jgi:hypothetical protein
MSSKTSIIKVLMIGFYKDKSVYAPYSGFGGLVVSVLASGTQDRGFKAVGFFG